jgi:hypothetical protein
MLSKTVTFVLVSVILLTVVVSAAVYMDTSSVVLADDFKPTKIWAKKPKATKKPKSTAVPNTAVPTAVSNTPEPTAVPNTRDFVTLSNLVHYTIVYTSPDKNSGDIYCICRDQYFLYMSALPGWYQINTPHGPGYVLQSHTKIVAR